MEFKNIANVHLFSFSLDFLIYFCYFCCHETETTMNKWIRRKRNSIGYGVQSPSDFHFVRHVLREKSPYYAYSTLKDMGTRYGDQLKHVPTSTHKLLFRITNYVQPDTIVEVGAGFSIFAMAMACPSAQCTAITSSVSHGNLLRSIQATQSTIEVRNGDEITIFSQLLREKQSIGILHVAHTPHYREIIDAALPYTSNRTLFIIEGIRDSKEKCNWWEGLQESTSTGISYDLKSIGLLFFDRTRHKNTYWINLRD
jgi:hypothetical protein